MEITKLKLKNYKQFQNVAFDFNPGLNVIMGKNEAGKSTLAQSLLDAFYLSPASSSLQVKSKRNWQNNGLAVIDLDLKTAAGLLKLNKDFAAKKAGLRFEKTNKEFTGAADVARELDKLLPFKSAEMYSGTAFITHDDIAELHTNSDDLVTAIQNIAVNGEAKVKVKSILESLEKQKRDLLRGITSKAANDGKIKAIRTKIVALQNEIDNLKQAITNNIKLQLELQDLTAFIDKAGPESEALKVLLENNKNSSSLEIQLGKAKQRFAQLQDQIDRLQKLQGALNDSREALQEQQIFLEEQTLADLEKLQTAAAQDTKSTNDEVMQKQQPVSAPKILKFIPLLVGLVIIIFGAFANQFWLIILGIIVLVSAIAFLLSEKAKSQQNLNASSEAIVQEEVFTKVEQQKLLAEYQSASIFELRERIKKAQALQTKVQSQEESLKTLTSGQSIDALIDQRNEALSEKLDFEKQLKNTDLQAGQGNRPSQLELNRFKLNLSNYEKDLKIARERNIEVNALLKQSHVNNEDLVILEERLEILSRQESRLTEEVEVIDLVSAGINHAISDLASASSQLIEAEINKYLPALTGERYHQVRFSSDLEIEVFSTEKNDWVNPDSELSRGTIDQVYFLARIAFIKLLTKGNPVPIILDDPFLTFDDVRLAAAVNILEELSKDFQIILFTFNPAYRQFGNLIRL